MQFAAFLGGGKEKLFPANGTVFKIVARWRCDWCANARGNCQNLSKWVQSLCAPLRPFRSELKKKLLRRSFTAYIVDVHPYKNISLPCYRVPRKTVKFVPVVPKAHVGTTFVRTESLLSRSIFKFQTANFPIFCKRRLIIVIIRTTCIGREVFLLWYGHWETGPAGIALPQKRHCLFLVFLICLFF